MKDTKEPQIELAIQFLMSNEVDAAEIICREVLLKNPFNAHAYDLLAVISSKTKRWDEALLTANKAIALDKNNGEFYNRSKLENFINNKGYKLYARIGTSDDIYVLNNIKINSNK